MHKVLDILKHWSQAVKKYHAHKKCEKKLKYIQWPIYHLLLSSMILLCQDLTAKNIRIEHCRDRSVRSGQVFESWSGRKQSKAMQR